MPQTEEEFLVAHAEELARQAGIRHIVGAGSSFLPPAHAVSAEMLRWLHRPAVARPGAHISEPVPPPLLEKLELDTGIIQFGGGVPVGGSSHLTLFPNGAFSFTGHFHDSGFPSYNTELVWIIRSATGTAFTFVHRGRVTGTYESGSRNDDWGESGTNAALAAAWADISAGYASQWNAGVNIDAGQLLDQTINIIGKVAKVVAVVA